MTNSELVLARWSGNLWIHRIVRHLLRLSLEMKLLIPNIVVILISLLAFAGWVSESGDANWRLEYLVISALIIGASANFILVRLALRPVKAIQRVAEQVAGGNMEARVRPSIIADVGLSQLADTLNDTLEFLTEARERIRERGAKVVYEQERERASVARELHESIGQTLAAASYQAAAATQVLEGHPAEQYAAEIARLLRTAMEDLRNVSRDLHPRVADDLGLPAALEALTRSTMSHSQIDVRLSVRGFNENIPSPAASTIYRITQEVLKNIECNAASGNVKIAVACDKDTIFLEINDDCQFPNTDPRLVHKSLAPQAERLSLLGGELVVDSNFLGGTKVTARLKRHQEAA